MLGQDVIVAFQNGKEEAFKVIYERYYQEMVWYANSKVSDIEEARDIAGNGFLTLWYKKQEINNETHMISFLVKVIKNACLNHLRNQQRAANNQQNLTDFLQEQEDPLTQLTRADLANLNKRLTDRIWKVINDLPYVRQQVMKLTFLDQLPDHEIAEKLNLSYSNIYTLRSRSLKSVRSKLTSPSTYAMLFLATSFYQFLKSL